MKIQSSAVLLLLAISPPRTSQAFQLDSPLAATGTARSRIKSWRHPCRKLLTDHVFPCQLSPLVTTSIISRMSSYRHPFEGSGLTLKGEEEKNQSSDNQLEEGGNKPPSMPEQSPKGIYQIKNEEQYNELLKANPDKLVVMKFYASYCQACKALEPMFIRVKEDKQLTNLPIVWAEWQSQRNNKDLFGRLGVLALPTVHFYDGSRGLIENFPCGPAKLPLLKQKLARFLNTRVDSQTLQLKDASEAQDDRSELDSEPAVERNVDTDNALITDEHINFLRNGMIFFQDLTDEEFTELLRKGRLLTFNPGDVIMRQGMPPTTFYVLKSGLAEMCIRSKFDDPIKTPPNYLGAVVNNLKSFDYFGERALSTGEPYAASVRVLEKTRAFAFHADDIPESSILSKKRKANDELTKQLSQRYELPKDYAPNYPVTQQDACVLELLVRFKQIRQVAKGFKYIMDSNPTFGDRGEIARRSVLVSKLSKAQRDEFQEVFDLIDVNKRGVISLMEIKKFMESARETKSTYELMQMLILANPNGISRDEFFGLMAEGEFYNLFTETFQELDPGNTGYVRAGDLDDVLGGVRDLIGDDSTSIIDTEDKDMLVDYEQFSKMLLGAAL